MNSISIIGRLVHDPDLRTTSKGTPVSNFRIARNERHGEEEQTLFVNVTAWNRLAETVKEYRHQGDQIAVSGRLRFEEYVDKDGVKRSSYSITANSIEFLAKKHNGNGKDQPQARPAQSDATAELEEIPF